MASLLHPRRRFLYRRPLLSALTLLSLSLLTACGVEELPENPPAGQLNMPRTIAWSAYPTGTGGYSQAVAIGNILQRQYGVNLRVVPGRNDVSRLATLQAGRVNMSAGGSEAVYAQEGILNFASHIWGPQPIRVLLSNYSTSCSFSFATAEDADIESVADIAGKRLTFVQGAPSLNNASTALLSYAGLTWDDVERVEVGGYNASIDAVINNRADVAGGACNSPPFLRLETSPRGLFWVPFPHDNPEGIARVRQRLPWYVPHVATQGPTIDPEEGVEVFTSAYPLLVSMADLDEDMVYGITKVISVHYDEYKNSAPGANGWRIDGQQLENAFIPYHEGAIRYFKEVGIWTPEAEERQQQNLYRQEVLKEAWDTFLPTAPEDREAFAEAWLEVRANHLAENGLITLSDSQ
ncbi:C4-dicarboxylate ABC transporter [Pseudohongiella nitratireducens]|uniref:C4-dicarboxylate ABC transporter n=1 Tax=Pseudohongiella nitratireducens TaxID=1768907 RepID=A0A917LRM2_9GAMM|nr:TAXI family TRAP transporter solute-binding subunit [Pseudohongiella nitratireducens]MDF1622075.1 TAXI family TRAP transporter solute-binding subunit [Pseudohongiella nitratireducens]GGG51602.1 C4-dicarboxylate ABC transporter [Pseudohongiella nitratireducens]